MWCTAYFVTLKCLGVDHQCDVYGRTDRQTDKITIAIACAALKILATCIIESSYVEASYYRTFRNALPSCMHGIRTPRPCFMQAYSLLEFIASTWWMWNSARWGRLPTLEWSQSNRSTVSTAFPSPVYTSFPVLLSCFSFSRGVSDVDGARFVIQWVENLYLLHSQCQWTNS